MELTFKDNFRVYTFIVWRVFMEHVMGDIPIRPLSRMLETHPWDQGKDKLYARCRAYVYSPWCYGWFSRSRYLGQIDNVNTDKRVVEFERWTDEEGRYIVTYPIEHLWVEVI